MLAGAGNASARLRTGVRAALLALATTAALSLGAPIHGWLFGADGEGIPLGLHVLREATLGLPVALAVAVAGLALAARGRRAPAPEPAPEPPSEPAPARPLPPAAAGSSAGLRPTRRALLTYGAGGLASVAIGVGALRRGQAVAAGTRTLELFVNDGEMALIDGRTAYVLGYGTARGPATSPCRAACSRPARGCPPSVSRTAR